MLKKILIIFLLLLVAGTGFLAYQYLVADSDINIENQTVLLLCADPEEQRPGLGGVDMAFALEIKDMKIKEVTPIYPGGMYHPTEPAPPEVQAQGLSVLVLHDSLWDADPKVGTKLAQEIVEYHTGIKTDTVVAVTPEVVDDMIQEVGPIYVPGRGYITGNSIEILREQQHKEGMSRGDAVESLMNPIFEASKDKQNFLALSRIGINHYVKGNVLVVPRSMATKLALSAGLDYLLK